MGNSTRQPIIITDHWDGYQVIFLDKTGDFFLIRIHMY